MTPGVSTKCTGLLASCVAFRRPLSHDTWHQHEVHRPPCSCDSCGHLELPRELAPWRLRISVHAPQRLREGRAEAVEALAGKLITQMASGTEHSRRVAGEPGSGAVPHDPIQWARAQSLHHGNGTVGAWTRPVSCCDGQDKGIQQQPSSKLMPRLQHLHRCMAVNVPVLDLTS